MLEATVISFDALGGTLVAAACVMLSALVLLGVASVTAREKEAITPRPEDEPQPGWPRPRTFGSQGVRYERRQRPADAVCMTGLPSRDARLPLAAGARAATAPPPQHPGDAAQPEPTAPAPPEQQRPHSTPTEESESGGSGEGRRHSSESSSQTSSSYQPLCPGLVVRQPGGISLAMVGTCAPYRQSEVVEFKRTDANRDVLARAILSEDSEGGGIVLESALRLPIAFMDTQGAVARRDAERPSSPSIAVSRMSGAGTCAEPPFCTVALDAAAEGCVMWRSSGSREDAAAVLAVRMHGDGRVANVVDAEGRLLAATESRRPEPGARPLRLLHIAAGVDSGLIMVAVIAAAKLGPAGSGP